MCDVSCILVSETLVLSGYTFSCPECVGDSCFVCTSDHQPKIKPNDSNYNDLNMEKQVYYYM